MKLKNISNQLTLINFLTWHRIIHTTIRKVWEVWSTFQRLREMADGKRLVRTQILTARGESRDSRLEWGNTRISESTLTFTITYYRVFQNVRDILQELQILLAPNKDHKKVFTEVLIVGFWNGESFKDYLVRVALSKMERFWTMWDHVCDHIITTNTFTTKTCEEVFKIQSGPLKRNSEKVLYLDTPYIEKAKTKLQNLWWYSLCWKG